MIDFNKIGFMQGRLSPIVNGRIQCFPTKFWKSEFKKAKELKLKYMEWTLDYTNFRKNPIFDNKEINSIKVLSKKNKIKIKTLTGDCFMEKPFWKKNDKYLINDFFNVVNACKKLKIKKIIIPLVDNSSLKNKRDEKKTRVQTRLRWTQRKRREEKKKAE